MRSRERLGLIAATLLLGIFLVTLALSILRRAENTFNYPSYSSLNNSKDGLKAYSDALGRLGFVTSRNFQPMSKLTGTQADLIYAGQSIRSLQFLNAKDMDLFERFAEDGGRLVLLLAPNGYFERKTNKTKKEETKPPEPTLQKRWGIEVAYHEELPKDNDALFLSKVGLIPFTWKFSSWSNDWIPSQTRNDSPLFLERRFGKGSILLVANARLFTNRELLAQPDSLILAALPGPHRQVIFDESHLGIADTGSVAGLATAHHLQWLLLGLMTLAALYIWRSSISFVPPVERQQEYSVTGQNAHVALARLLMQSVPQRAVLLAAAEEWNRSRTFMARSAQEISANDMEHLRSLSPDHSPAEYNALAKRVQARQLH